VIKIHFSVKREYVLTILRLILPVTLLTFISWSGFFISPTQLMPRFASAFISFLTLAGYRNQALKMMPNEGALGEICWADTYISVLGIFMFLSAVETVLAQYLYENVCRVVAHTLDNTARIVFPGAYFAFLVFMCVPNIDPIPLVTGSHIIVALFFSGYAGHCIYEARNWPALYLRRNIKPAMSGSERQKPHKLTRRELSVIFDMLAKRQHGGKVDAAHGFVKLDVIWEWVLQSTPILNGDKNQSATRALLQASLGHDEFAFPTFEAEFAYIITRLTLLVHGHFELDEATQSLIDMSLCRSSEEFQEEKSVTIRHRKPNKAALHEDEQKRDKTTAAQSPADVKKQDVGTLSGPGNNDVPEVKMDINPDAMMDISNEQGEGMKRQNSPHGTPLRTL